MINNVRLLALIMYMSLSSRDSVPFQKKLDVVSTNRLTCGSVFTFSLPIPKPKPEGVITHSKGSVNSVQDCVHNEIPYTAMLNTE